MIFKISFHICLVVTFLYCDIIPSSIKLGENILFFPYAFRAHAAKKVIPVLDYAYVATKAPTKKHRS